MTTVVLTILTIIAFVLFCVAVNENEKRLNAEADLEVARFQRDLYRHPSYRGEEPEWFKELGL